MPCFLSLWVFVIGYIARDALFSKFQNQEKNTGLNCSTDSFTITYFSLFPFARLSLRATACRTHKLQLEHVSPFRQ